METALMETVEVDGLTLAYRSAGTGPPVLLLHGWPTSSYLWRDVIPQIAQHNRVIAVDLPGFGRSSKPLEGYDFAFFGRVLDGLLSALGVEQLALAAHDLGGPIALHWALHRPGRVTRLALLNTVVYPEFSLTAIEFVRTLLSPARRAGLTSPQALEDLMRAGVADGATLSSDLIDAVQAPFQSEPARLALAAAGVHLRASGFVEIARLLKTLTIPVRIIYGAQDRLLPDIAETVARLRDDLPQAEVTELPDCGHFVQEDAPVQVGALLAQFFAARRSGE
ncbi:MAG: alpha/beta fold hydrolase [Pseudonocardiales bacterium]|nr:alpha/beta fold hydrolase [Pseudonocardiales bacterium]